MLNAAPLAIARDGLLAVLEESRACVQEMWPAGHPTRTSLIGLSERLQENRLQVAVLGQFKRGKSTFINALLGAPLLPAAVVPVTAIPTFIAWGAVLQIRVSYLDGRPADEFRPADVAEAQQNLRHWVTEDGNPENRRGVAHVDLFFPAEALRDGIVLIDTPGIGSTLRHNTDAALQVLPQCDAALFVLSADPPITEAELAYLATVQSHVVHLSFVLNKIDYLSLRELADVLTFVRRAVPGSTPPQVFPLSARRALAARTSRDGSALEDSGLRRIELDLLHTLVRDKAAALQASVGTKLPALLDQMAADLALQTRALELPLGDLEQRSQALRDSLQNTERERQAARDLLEGDRGRAIAELESQAERLRRDAGAYLTAAMTGSAAQHDDIPDYAAAHAALEEAVPAFFASRLAAVAAEFRQLVEAMLARHQARADALVTSVREAAAASFDVPFRVAAETEPFRLGPQPYWVTQNWANVLMPSPASLLVWLLPGALRRQRRRQRLAQQIDAVVQHNVENLRWATLRGVDDTFRRFSAQLDERLADVLAVTEGVIGAAVALRQANADDAAAELRRLHELTQRLTELCARLRQPAGT